MERDQQRQHEQQRRQREEEGGEEEIAGKERGEPLPRPGLESRAHRGDASKVIFLKKTLKNAKLFFKNYCNLNSFMV